MRARTRCPPVMSCHVMHGPVGVPLASTGTVEAHCPVIATAATLDGAADDAESRRLAAPQMSSHHATGSWTALRCGPKIVSTLWSS